MKRTKVDTSLEVLASMHENDPQRFEAIQRARRFKSSWIELAEVLTEVRKAGRFREWGYGSFEEYAKTELHLRQETVDKLTGSFLFLKKTAPEVLTRDGVSAPIPDYNAVDFLRRAEEKPGAPEAMVDEIRKRVIEDGSAHQTIAKKYKDTVFPIGDGERRERDAAALRNVATRLRDLLGETHVLEEAFSGEVRTALERLLGALPKPPERERADKAA